MMIPLEDEIFLLWSKTQDLDFVVKEQELNQEWARRSGVVCGDRGRR